MYLHLIDFCRIWTFAQVKLTEITTLFQSGFNSK